MCRPVYNDLLLVLSISFDSTPKAIYKSSQIAKAFENENLEFLSGEQDQNFIIQPLLVILPAESDAILEKKYCKRYAVRFFALAVA